MNFTKKEEKSGEGEAKRREVRECKSAGRGKCGEEESAGLCSTGCKGDGETVPPTAIDPLPLFIALFSF